MLPHLRTSLLHRYIIARNRTLWFADNIGATSLHPYPQAWSREFEFNVFELNLRI
jgi:hypothetical protein